MSFFPFPSEWVAQVGYCSLSRVPRKRAPQNSKDSQGADQSRIVCPQMAQIVCSGTSRSALVFCYFDLLEGIWLFEIVRVFDGAQNGAVINYNTLFRVTPWTCGWEFLHALSGSSAPWALRATSVWRNKRRYRSHTRVTWLMWVMVREAWWPGISLVIVKISSNSLFFVDL